MTFGGGGELTRYQRICSTSFSHDNTFNSFNSFTPKDRLNTIIMIIVIIKLLRTACTSNLSF